MTNDVNYWAQWFWGTLFPDWVSHVSDEQGGVFDLLDLDGIPLRTSEKTLLAQARTLFTLSHAALALGDSALVAAAKNQVAFVRKYEKASGLYRCKMNQNGTVTGNREDELARSYDQTFVILGLVTWNKISPSTEVCSWINECWTALQSKLTDQATGFLLNDDSGLDTGPAQNPHMHLYEACLQAFRMTSDVIWLDRAARLRKLGLRYFMDETSGSITEFLTPDLRPLPDSAGHRREVGHQCEWGWLLLEEAELTKNESLKEPAHRLFRFANKYGFATGGLFEGAVFDAVSSKGVVLENSFLLWPQTEVIKILSTYHRAGDPLAGERAKKLMCLMFERWFADYRFYVNQFDGDGKVLWDESLTRLMYHIVIAMTEGARAGLWSGAPFQTEV